MELSNIKLKLISEGDFLGTKCDFYTDEVNNVYMTREQVGEALEYSDPIRNISKLHERNKERLDKFFRVATLRASDNKLYKQVLYSKDGIIEIVKISAQHPKLKKALLKNIGCDSKTVDLVTMINVNIKYKQHELYNILSTVYPNFNIKSEVKIDNYRVDYILNDSIIVECDEYGHQDRNEDYEKGREDYLTKLLGYKIIRYNPDSKNKLEIFNIIRQINDCLYNCA